MNERIRDLITNFRAHLEKGLIIIIKDYSQLRGNYDPETKLWHSDYDRFQVLLCKYGSFKFIIRTLLYPQHSHEDKYIENIKQQYTEFNNLDNNFMKYYGSSLCYHKTSLPLSSYRGGLYEILGRSYCTEYSSSSKNEVMFFEYHDHDNTLDEFISMNYHNIYDISIIYELLLNILYKAYHETGFVHHDLNLRNILITRTDTSYDIKLIDFDDSKMGDNKHAFISDIKTLTFNIIGKVGRFLESDSDVRESLTVTLKDIETRTNIKYGIISSLT